MKSTKLIASVAVMALVGAVWMATAPNRTLHVPSAEAGDGVEFTSPQIAQFPNPVSPPIASTSDEPAASTPHGFTDEPTPDTSAQSPQRHSPTVPSTSALHSHAETHAHEHEPSPFVSPSVSPKPTDAKLPTVQVEMPLGLWRREYGPMSLTIQFEADRWHALFVGKVDDTPVQIELDGDWSATKDSQVFGLVTGTVMRIENEDGDPLETQMSAEAVAAQITDQPFAVRFRVDGDVLTIKDFRFGANSVLAKAGIEGEMLQAFIAGRYDRLKHPDSSRHPTAVDPSSSAQFFLNLNR